MTADEDWQVDRLREDGDPNHDSDIQRAVDKANKAREQGADVVAIAMHSVQEYLDYADSGRFRKPMSLPTLVPSTLFTVPVAIVRSPSRTITARGLSTVWATPSPSRRTRRKPWSTIRV